MPPFIIYKQKKLDGMHLCPETFHGRINTALVCLLDCKYNQQQQRTALMECSDGCNAKFMNLDPISFPLNENLIGEVPLTSI